VQVEITLIGTLGRSIEKRLDPVQEKVREDRETGRREAAGFAKEALYEVVALMRVTTDPNVKLKAAKLIMDRGWGQTKALTEEEKKSADAGTILDILASVSASMTAIENEATGVKQIASDNEEEDDSYFDADAILVEAEQEPRNG